MYQNLCDEKICYNLALISDGILFFHEGHAEKIILERTMTYLQRKTCIKFIEIEPSYELHSVHVHDHYVLFISTTKKR